MSASLVPSQVAFEDRLWVTQPWPGSRLAKCERHESRATVRATAVAQVGMEMQSGHFEAQASQPVEQARVAERRQCHLAERDAEQCLQ